MAAVHAAAAPTAGCRLTVVASASGRSSRSLAGEADARRIPVADLPGGAEVMVVATPTTTHTELATRGASAGAVVLVESPWCTSAADADDLLAADAAGPGRIRGAAPTRCSPAWRATMAERRTLGPIRHLSGCCALPAPDWGHLGADLDDGIRIRLSAATALPLLEDLAGGPVVGVAAARTASGHELRPTFRTPQGDLDATVELRIGAGSEVWFQASADDGVVRVELAPGRLLERNGGPIVLPSGSAADDPLVRAGYVDQLSGLGLDGDLTVDPATIRRLTAATDAALRSLGASGDRVEVR